MKNSRVILVFLTFDTQHMREEAKNMPCKSMGCNGSEKLCFIKANKFKDLHL